MGVCGGECLFLVFERGPRVELFVVQGSADRAQLPPADAATAPFRQPLHSEWPWPRVTGSSICSRHTGHSKRSSCYAAAMVATRGRSRQRQTVETDSQIEQHTRPRRGVDSADTPSLRSFRAGAEVRGNLTRSNRVLRCRACEHLMAALLRLRARFFLKKKDN